MVRTRPYKIEVALNKEEKETIQILAQKAHLTYSQLIRSIIITRDLTMDELGDPSKELQKQKDALAKQQSELDRAERSIPLSSRGEPVIEPRKYNVRVMLSAAEKNALIARANILHMSLSDLVRRSALYGKIEKTNFDIGAAQQIHHELLKEGVNLNQLMYFLNSNGIGGYDSDLAQRVAKKVWRAADRCDRFIEVMEKRFGVDYIPLEPDGDEYN